MIDGQTFRPEIRAKRTMAAAERILQGYLAHKKLPPLGPYSRTMPRALWWPRGGGQFLMSGVPL